MMSTARQDCAFSSIYIAPIARTNRRLGSVPRSRALAILFSLLLCGIASAAFSAERFSITVGGKSGWGSLESATSLQQTEGRLALPALGIAPGTVSKAQAELDLYLSFNSANFADEAGNYSIVSSNAFFSGAEMARQGAGAAIFNTTGSGISLHGNPGSMLASRGELPSFSISFWLYPTSTDNGSVILSWRSSILPPGSLTPIYQSIAASFEQNRLVWDFSNIWISELRESFSTRLTPSRIIIPKKWSFHQISYDSNTGFLEYRIDGRTEDAVYIASGSGRRRTAIAGFISGQSDLEIASKYSGLIDEFKIEKGALSDVSIESLRDVAGFYPAAGGKFTTVPLNTGKGAARLVSADISVIEPEGTESEFYVRAGDNFYAWTENSPRWVPLVNGKPAEEVSGQYFQIAGGLYPDGTRSKTPLLTWISLNLEKENAPWPPLKVRGEAGNGSVRISWNPPADSSARGYLVYYGEGQGEYLSQGSPIDAGNSLSCVISGLENGKMYYFAVASYGDAGPSYPGGFSPEIAVRPLMTKTLQER